MPTRISSIPKEVLLVCVKEYTETDISIPQLAKKVGVPYRNLKYYLKTNGFPIEKRSNGHIGLIRSAETRSNISKAKAGKPNLLKRGKTYSSEQRLNITRAMHKYSTNLMEFIDDVDKFLLIKEFAYRHLSEKDESTIFQFIRKFYYDPRFDKIYENWKLNNFDKLFKPSIDHITPVSRGGDSTIENFQVLTWFENRVKNNMTDDEWSKFKTNTHTLSDLFIR